MRNSQYCEKLENEKKDETKIKFLSLKANGDSSILLPAETPG